MEKVLSVFELDLADDEEQSVTPPRASGLWSASPRKAFGSIRPLQKYVGAPQKPHGDL